MVMAVVAGVLGCFDAHNLATKLHPCLVHHSHAAGFRFDSDLCLGPGCGGRLFGCTGGRRRRFFIEQKGGVAPGS